MPPPPAKADIATAILTNVIEHIVWLFAPQQARLHRQSGVGGFLHFSIPKKDDELNASSIFSGV